MQNEPAISVIVPVFNTEKRLRACVDSLLAQSWKNLEIILSDDGSTDGSLSICREYAEKFGNVKLVCGENGGVCAARNRGLNAASGEWVAFCDSDDETLPDLYKTLILRAEKFSADLSLCAWVDIGPNETKAATNFQFSSELLLDGRREILERFFIPLLNDSPNVHGYLFAALFRREILLRENIRFPEGVNMKEDEIFMAEYLAAAQRVAATDRILYKYIRFSTSACSAYYRSRSDYFRERNWAERSRHQLRVFLKAGLEKQYPQMLADLRTKLAVHLVQTVVCAPNTGLSAKFAELKKISKQTFATPLSASGMSARTFLFCLKYCRIALPLLCRLKRDYDLYRRTRKNARRGEK